jgi:hypothetical protein
MPAKDKICQDGHQITSTMRHTATPHLKLCCMTVKRLPLVYKRRRRPPSRGGQTDDARTSARSLAPTYNIGIHLNQFAGTWRLLLLSRLACRPLYKHHGALQYSATSATLLDVRPTVGTRINLVPHRCLAPDIERPISAHLLLSVRTTFRTDNRPSMEPVRRPMANNGGTRRRDGVEVEGPRPLDLEGRGVLNILL